MKINWKRNIKTGKNDRKVLSFLVTLLFLLYAYTFYYKPRLILNDSEISISQILSPINSELERNKIISAAKINLNKKHGKKKKENSYPKIKYENFNPNNIDSLQWLKLGVKPWTIKTISSYKKKGGKFYICKDLSKIYNLPDSTYQSLLPYCTISKVKKTYPKKKYEKKRKHKAMYPPANYEDFNPNTADSLQWLKLGVKPWTIKTILSYKKKGGKFYKCEDLSKIYNLPDSTYQKILPYCNIPSKSKEEKKRSGKGNPHNRKRSDKVININTATKEELISLWGIGPVVS